MNLSESTPHVRSESVKELYRKLAILRDSGFGFKASAENKAFAKGGAKGNMYAPLPEMMENFNEAIKKLNLSLYLSTGPLLKGAMIKIEDYETGEFEARYFAFPLNAGNNPNEWKGFNTSGARYAMSGFLNIPSDPDYDNVDLTHPEVFKGTTGFKPDNSNEELGWLNLNTTQFIAAKKDLTEGKVNLADINKKYRLSNEVIKKLQS